MATEYKPAPDVEEIAQALLSQYHRHLLENDVPIRYSFCSGFPKSKGKVRWGIAKKINKEVAHLAEMDGEGFHIIITGAVWRGLNDIQKMALVDHELCHCLVEEDPETEEIKLSLRPHDLEEFREIVDRYGLWESDTEEFGKSVAPYVKQLRLMMENAADIAALAPDDGDNLSSVTLSHAGKSVTLTKETGRKAREMLTAAGK